MKQNQILEFICHNSSEQLKSYQSELKESLKDLEQSIKRLYFWMIMTGVLYYLFRTTAITSFEFSIIKLSDLKIIEILTPPLFSIMLLYNFLFNNRKAELLHFSKLIAFKLYKTGKIHHLDLIAGRPKDYVRLIQPFSISNELMKRDNLIKVSVFETVLRLPSLIIGTGPIIFAFICTKHLFISYFNSFATKISFLFTVWLLSYAAFLLGKVIYHEAKNAQKAEEHISDFERLFNK